ncbi:MAG: phenylalanine--tRNA ligase subunit alpha, partial [Anaerolineae bacterium]
MNLFEALEQAYQDAQSALEAAEDTSALEAWYADMLGRKGAITLQVRVVGQLPAEDRPAFGKRV